MKISTKGRYALRVMIDLATRSLKGEGYVSIKQIALNQNVSIKYLEMIVGMLLQAGFVTSLRGKNGGYMLAVPPDSLTAGAVLKLTEGDLSPVACLKCEQNPCARAGTCETLAFWKGLDRVIDAYVESVTIADLVTNAGARRVPQET